MGRVLLSFGLFIESVKLYGLTDCVKLCVDK